MEYKQLITDVPSVTQFENVNNFTVIIERVEKRKTLLSSPMSHCFLVRV